MITDFDQSAGPFLAYKRYKVRRIINTFLSFSFLFDVVITDEDFDAVLSGAIVRTPSYLRSRLLQKALWFWPRVIEARMWTEGGPEKSQRPENFLTFDSASRALCDAVENYALSKDAPILDLGCNVGRHLSNLRSRGFTNLTGVDAMADALQQMPIRFPNTTTGVDLHCDLFQRFLRSQSNLSFDVLYTHGATIELIHPSFNIVRHMCRVTESYIVLIQNETHRTEYPRLWLYEFARNGFYLREARRPVGKIPPSDPVDGLSLLVFRRFQAQPE